jgi:transposase-like protein
MKGGDTENLFKWRHFQPEIILLCVWWYLRYALSYKKNLGEMMTERELSLDHTKAHQLDKKRAPGGAIWGGEKEEKVCCLDHLNYRSAPLFSL